MVLVLFMEVACTANQLSTPRLLRVRTLTKLSSSMVLSVSPSSAYASRSSCGFSRYDVGERLMFDSNNFPWFTVDRQIMTHTHGHT
jgi:hypothetical protein